MRSGATETSYIHLQKHYQFPKNVFVSHLPEELKKSNHTYKILWAHHAYDQPLFLNFDHYTVNHIVSPSQWNKEQFIKYHNVPDQKITVIPNGISDVFSYSDKKSKTMIYTSVPYKGLEVLVDIIPLIQKKHPDVKFKIFSSMSLYGLSDERYEELYNKINSLSNVDYSPAIEQEELVKYYQESAFFVHPNIWEETFCVSMVEAMKCGCFPIITNIGALQEVAGEKNAFTVPIEGTVTPTGYKVTKNFINNFANTCCIALDHFDSDKKYYAKVIKKISDYVSEKYRWDSISHLWKNLIYQICIEPMEDLTKDVLQSSIEVKNISNKSESSIEIETITAEEVVNNVDDYILQASENVLKWDESDKEFCQSRTNFQIEKFIALNSFKVSVTFEHILKERKVMARAYMQKLIEMKMKVREFEYKWEKVEDKTKPLIKFNPDQPEVLNWYDLEELSMKHYLKECEIEIRDRLYQLEHLDKLLERLIEINGGNPPTREQFLEESGEYWEMRLAQQALDDLLAGCLGISGGNINAMRQASAPSIIDDRNELKNGFLPMNMLMTPEGRGEFIADLQKKVINGFDTFANKPLLTQKEDSNVKKIIGEKNWFNEEYMNNSEGHREQYFGNSNSNVNGYYSEE